MARTKAPASAVDRPPAKRKLKRKKISKAKKEAITTKLPPDVVNDLRGLSDATKVPQAVILEKALRLYMNKPELKRLAKAAEAAGL